MMGTYPKPCPLTPVQIAERYQGGECLGLLSLRCRRPMAWVKDVLIAQGVALRTKKQVYAAMAGSRTLKPRRFPPPKGSNPWGSP